MRSMHCRDGLLATLMAGLCLAGPAGAVQPGEVVDNFRLIDQAGKSHELYYLSDMKAVVLAAYGLGCEASQSAAAALEKLRTTHADAAILMIDSNLGDARDAVERTAAAGGFSVPVLMDPAQIIGESLGLSVNGEALVLNPQGWKVVYRGAVNEALGDALAALSAGESVRTASTAVQGCAIAMPERERRAAHARISYADEIAPMLLDKCVACHRAGGIGPWHMTGYEMIKGFAPMIREVVRTQRMPPWHADPHYQTFSNDRGMTPEQVRTLVHWIEAGAPRGEGADPLLSQRKDWPQWPLGEPDLVVEMPAFTTPATGVIPYQNVKVQNPLDHDVWVRAVDYVPGDRTVLHHVIATASGAERRGPGAVSLNNYVPGAEPLEVPEDNGILLRAGSTFHFQMHYTPNGRETTDVTRMGLYFMKEAPKYHFRSMILANPRLKIPPRAKEHVEIAEQTFKEDSVIYSVHPHSHFRGKAARFVAIYPDGREEMLLNVPAYDFNWQSTYDLTTPITVPAGTKVVYTTIFDNSTQNKANPDPDREVPWGEQTWDEMVFGVIRYRLLTEDPTGAAEHVLTRRASRR